MKPKRTPRGGLSNSRSGTMPKGAGTRRKKSSPVSNSSSRAKTNRPYKAEPKPGTAEFKRLQDKWYAKLADDGFNDLEWTAETGINEAFLRHSFSTKPFPAKAQFYRLLQNYVTHGLTGKKSRRKDEFMLKLCNEGGTDRTISQALIKGRFGRPNSLYWVHYRMKKLIAVMIAWNKTHPEGLLNPANADKWAEDCLLADLGLDIGNGILVAQGWWADNVGGWWDSTH